MHANKTKLKDGIQIYYSLHTKEKAAFEVSGTDPQENPPILTKSN